MAKQKIQNTQITLRLRESTLQWLENESHKSGQSTAELIREGIELLQAQRKYRDTQEIQGIISEYLNILEASELSEGFDYLIDQIKERISGKC
jgi:Arc/MetJ-type ribon-helix-helix transcriptional regulator